MTQAGSRLKETPKEEVEGGGSGDDHDAHDDEGGNSDDGSGDDDDCRWIEEDIKGGGWRRWPPGQKAKKNVRGQISLDDFLPYRGHSKIFGDVRILSG